ncbi:MAG: di-heme oxidoredictase family protein [Planctomycetota bacterium]
MISPFPRPLAGAVVALLASPALGQGLVTPEPQPLMGEPVRGLTADEADRFLAGLAAFSAPVLPADGAGPIFNELTCAGCHNVPAVGGFGARRVTRFGIAATSTTPFQGLEGLGGTLLQDQSLDIACRETLPAQANHTALRGTPIVFGLGLIEAIPDSVLVGRANNQPSGVVGRIHSVIPFETPGGVRRVGRFGWKGGIATVQSFSLDAALNEMGLTSQFLPNENAPNGDLALLAQCDTVADPEDVPDAQGVRRTDRFTDFQRLLAPPPQTPKSGMTGEAIFEAIGCADCHVGAYTTGVVAEAALSNQLIRPYSDFLLHDMGDLGDGIVEGEATETEMMTRTLWGLAQRPALLHDGRATGGGSFELDVELAIAQHGGTALPSAMAYQALTQDDKDFVLAFLGSLGRAEFDWETNNTIDEIDWFFLEPLVTGPAPATPLTPDDEGAIGDVDQDGDFDLVEFGLLQRVWTGQ